MNYNQKCNAMDVISCLCVKKCFRIRSLLIFLRNMYVIVGNLPGR